MKRYVKLLCAALSLVLMLSLLPVGAFAAVVRPGATDGAGGVANAIEDFLKGNLKDPSASEVIGKVTDVITGIDVENMENVIASKLANYDYAAASQLIGSGILKITQKAADDIAAKANGQMTDDAKKGCQTRYFWVFKCDDAFYTSTSKDLVLEPAAGAEVHMIGMSLSGQYVELVTKTDALGMATFDDVPYGQYFCGASYTDPDTGYAYETETMSEHVWVPASGRLQNLTMTRVDALSNAYIDQIKRELVAKGCDLTDVFKPGSASTDISDGTTPLASGAPELNTKDHNAYIKGVGGGKFAPAGTLTRAAAAQMLYNLLTDESRAQYYITTNSFTDVSAGKWYNAAVSTLANAGVIDGYKDGTFKPDRAITRAEFIKLVVAMYGVNESASASFTDLSTSNWAYKYIATAAAKGWITGYTDGSCGAARNMQRGEAVTFMNRVLGRVCDTSYVSANRASLVTFTDVPAGLWCYGAVMEAANGHTYTLSGASETWTGRR
jgi:hypothetical protein